MMPEDKQKPEVQQQPIQEKQSVQMQQKSETPVEPKKLPWWIWVIILVAILSLGATSYLLFLK